MNLNKLTKKVKQIQKDGVMRCATCGKPMINAVDSITGEVSKYLWKTTCKHSKNAILMVG